MTREENSIVAEAQAAYQEGFKGIKNTDRGLYLYRLGLISLLEAELRIAHEDIDS